MISIHGCGVESATSRREALGVAGGEQEAGEAAQVADEAGALEIEGVEERDSVAREGGGLDRTGGRVGPAEARRSGAMSRRSAGSRWRTSRHGYQCWGQPWRSRSGSPTPASATWTRSPPRLDEAVLDALDLRERSVTRRRAYGP